MGKQKKVFFDHLKLLVIGTLLITFIAHASQTITNKDIQEIYEKFVSTNFTCEYRDRYVPFPFHKNTKKWKWEGKDFPRVIAVLEFEKFITENHITAEKALFINGDDPEAEYLPTQNKRIIWYKQDPEHYDLHKLQLQEQDYDFVMVNQTLEHVYDPIRCLANVHKHMKRGGILYLNIPVLNVPHDTPFNFYTGFTPTGLGVLATLAGFRVLSIGQWGNRLFIEKLFSGFNWPDFLQLSLGSKIFSLNSLQQNPLNKSIWPDIDSLKKEADNFGLNELEHPVIAWIFAQKD